jgi:hypothetical protein
MTELQSSSVLSHSGDGLKPFITQLREMVVALPAHRPDGSVGIAWDNYDVALSSLHDALIALTVLELHTEATP